MAAMQIRATNDFAAPPATTHAMLTDPGYLTRVSEESGDVSQRVDSTDALSAVERQMVTPSAVRRFLGETLTMRQEVHWQPAAEDGSRSGDLTLTIDGMPARAEVGIQLRPGGRGTVVDFAGEFTISVPFVGRSLEAKAAPALTEGFAVQQRVGDDWLASRG
jgi:hypothetical protein